VQNPTDTGESKVINAGQSEITGRSCCIVPIYNEASVIFDCITDLKTVFPNILCVDDGSTDNSGVIAKQAGAIVIQHRLNIGQGAAIATGVFWALSQKKFKNIVTFDGDGQHRPEDALRLVKELEENNLDIVFGSRFLGHNKNSVPVIKRLVLRFATATTRILTGIYLSDAHNGLRAITIQAARQISITQRGMAHASQIVNSVKTENLKYNEIPVTVLYTEYSKKKGQPLLNSINILIDLIWGDS